MKPYTVSIKRKRSPISANMAANALLIAVGAIIGILFFTKGFLNAIDRQASYERHAHADRCAVWSQTSQELFNQYCGEKK